MEDILRAIVLGIIQGLTEFLPISSSGHLIVARDLFGWEFADDLTFDVALHVGTTVAVIAFFWKEWLAMLRGGLAYVFSRSQRERSSESIYDARLLLLLALGSVPTAMVGLIFTTFLEDEVRDPIVVGVMLVIFGAVLFAAERIGSHRRTIDSTGWQDAVAIGLAQAISLLPGTSRSGVTISAGMARGFTRHDAARFSFLLATPAIIGAGALKTGEAIVDGIPSGDADVIAVGAVVSAIVGWMSIGWLLRLLQSSTFAPFVGYRLVAGVFVLVYFTV
jgi:undecaprenyl-diphosphatase